MKIKERSEISKEYMWNLEDIYSNNEELEEELKKLEKDWEIISKMKGNLTSNSTNLLEGLVLRDEILRIVEKIFSYASMKFDEDTRVNESQELFDKAISLYSKSLDILSFIIPEILSADENNLKKYIKEDSRLKIYEHFIDDILRRKEHILSDKEESIIAQYSEALMAPENIYSIFNGADLTFPVINKNGTEIEITQGNFIQLLEDRDREFRKKVFYEFYNVFFKFRNTLASTLNGNIKKNIITARIRNYSSALEASLSENNVDVIVYDNLLDSIHRNLDSMHKYVEVRKKALKLDEINMYDLYTPLVENIDDSIDYEKAKNMVLEGLKPLGDEYISIVEGAFKDGWIDVYENKGKRSGAYSGGSYDTKPYILLNYHERLDDVFTLAHELGHSMHSYYTRENQPYINGNYSIFVAEVASTVNEILLLLDLLNKATNSKEKAYLLNHYLESFRTTVFRQAMFAEFEKSIYEYVEKDNAITADYLNKTYRDLNRLYYGNSIILDDLIDIEWARIPHFYYNFYVYQYATGFCSAVTLANDIYNKKEGSLEKYIEFLKSGNSDYPLNVLKKAGVDMSTNEPLERSLKVFRNLVDEFDKLI
ncbi:MAG: oligoendopeptidase F [Tissierellales bacterium]|nr:oligoendopeptidase F [Tissierellales bacterium]